MLQTASISSVLVSVALLVGCRTPLPPPPKIVTVTGDPIPGARLLPSQVLALANKAMENDGEKLSEYTQDYFSYSPDLKEWTIGYRHKSHLLWTDRMIAVIDIDSSTRFIPQQ